MVGVFFLTSKQRSFTTLGIINSQMHPSEELQDIVDVFDGKMRVSEKETSEGIKQVIKIKSLVNKKYSDKEIGFTKEALND